MSTITSEIKLRIKTEGDAALTGLGAKLNSLANQATASSQTFKGLAAELRNVQSTTVQSTNNLKAYSASWRELAGSVDIASKEFREARIEAARLDAQIAKAEGRKGRGGRIAGAAQTVGAIAASGVFGGPEGALGAGIGAIAGGPMGAAVGGAIGAQVGMIRQALGATGEYVAELSKLQIALAGVSRNSNEYEKNLSAVSRLSDQFLIPLKDTTQQYTKLQASVVGAGMETKQTETVFKGISAAILATGGTTEDLNSALRATSQVFSKGKVSAEELRQQIGERLPGAFTIFAASMGKTPEELDKALERGEVTLEDFIKFSEDLFKRYGKTAKIIAEAPQNAGARLKLALDKINQDVGRLTQPIGATFQTLGEEMLKGLSPVLKAFADLIDAPKQLAKERLPQIERQLKEANSQLIQARKFKGGLYGDSSLFGLINQKDEESILKTIKKLKSEEALLKAQIDQIGSATDDARRQKKAEEEKAITTIKEKAIIQLRELEEKTINDLADLREKQIQRALDLERQIADQRLKVEREIQDLRQENVYAGEDFQYLEEFRKLQGLGESTAALDIGQKTRESIRAFDKERIQIQRTSEDESQQRQKTLEAFKKTNADEIGRIQLNYTRQSSNILQKAGDELKKAMKEGAQEYRKSVMEAVVRFIRVGLGLPAQKPQDDGGPLTAPPPPVLPPPANLRPNQQANSAAAGVGMQITSSMTRPIPSSQQIVVQPFAGVQTETQRLSESQESKNKLELQKKASKFLKEQKEQQTAILAPLQNQDKLYKEQAENRQRLNELIRGGATPALAEEYLQIEKIGTERRKGLEAFGDELKKQTNLNGLTKEQLEYRKNLINQNNTYILGIDEAINKTKALAAENERVKTTQAEIKQLWDGISETIGGGVGQAVDLLIKGTEDFGTSLQNIASGILKDIASQIARMLVIQPIVAGLKSLFPFANGGIMTSQGPMPLKRYAAGGIANSPQLAMYGEGRMPEAYVPLPDGRRIPVAMQGGGGTTNVVVNVDAGGTSVQGDAPRGDQLGKALSAAVQAELIKQRRPGGLLA